MWFGSGIQTGCLYLRRELVTVSRYHTGGQGGLSLGRKRASSDQRRSSSSGHRADADTTPGRQGTVREQGGYADRFT